MSIPDYSGAVIQVRNVTDHIRDPKVFPSMFTVNPTIYKAPVWFYQSCSSRGLFLGHGVADCYASITRLGYDWNKSEFSVHLYTKGSLLTARADSAGMTKKHEMTKHFNTIPVRQP